MREAGGPAIFLLLCDTCFPRGSEPRTGLMISSSFILHLLLCVCVCVCVCACVRACVRACVCVRVRACVRACVRT